MCYNCEVQCVTLTEELPYIKCPLHTVLKLTPTAYCENLLHISIYIMCVLMCVAS